MSDVQVETTRNTEAGTLTVVEHHGVTGFYWEIQGRDCTITAELRPFYCDRGNYIAKLHPNPGSALALEIDASDGWPRYFFDRDRMFEELSAWLHKRGQMPDAVE